MHRYSEGRSIFIIFIAAALMIIQGSAISAASESGQRTSSELIFSKDIHPKQGISSSSGEDGSRSFFPTSHHSGSQERYGEPETLPSETKSTKLLMLATISLADYFQTVDFLYKQKNIVGMNYYYFVNAGRKTEVMKISSAQFSSVPQIYSSRAVKAPVYEVSTEGNPLLGPRPRPEQLLAFGAAGMGLTALLAYTLPEPLAEMVVNSVLASEAGNVLRNSALVHSKSGWDRVAAIPLVMSFRF